jgi:hypothetical protein
VLVVDAWQRRGLARGGGRLDAKNSAIIMSAVLLILGVALISNGVMGV